MRTSIVLAAAALFASMSALAQDKIVLGFASFGGAYQEAQRKAFLEPTAKALNISFREDTWILAPARCAASAKPRT